MKLTGEQTAVLLGAARTVPDDTRDLFFKLVADELRGAERLRNADVKAAVMSARGKCRALRLLAPVSCDDESRTDRLGRSSSAKHHFESGHRSPCRYELLIVGSNQDVPSKTFGHRDSFSSRTVRGSLQFSFVLGMLGSLRSLAYSSSHPSRCKSSRTGSTRIGRFLRWRIYRQLRRD